MPRWVSTTLIVIGFLALVGLAFVPRNVAVNVTINADDRDVSGHEHAEPAPNPPSP
ncbi:MAG: hypothetical protein K2Q06_12705 [Parvularculaceae bacterium]|nr:hypothetical protein [Parvularculaceae bacterium]